MLSVCGKMTRLCVSSSSKHPVLICTRMVPPTHHTRDAIERVLHWEACTAQAALDVFQKEPPPADNPLTGRDDVICTPHLGASTREAQEGVAVEIAEAVVSALKVCLQACVLCLCSG